MKTIIIAALSATLFSGLVSGHLRLPSGMSLGTPDIPPVAECGVCGEHQGPYYFSLGAVNPETQRVESAVQMCGSCAIAREIDFFPTGEAADRIRWGD